MTYLRGFVAILSVGTFACSSGGSSSDGLPSATCHVDDDCETGVCTGGSCVPAPTCGDGIQNGAETGVDCGGPVCPTCGDITCSVDGDCSSGACIGGTCVEASCSPPECAVATDCRSRVCIDLACQEPSCTDGVPNGSETDVDCGGLCPACVSDRHCLVNADCASGYCVANVCQDSSGGGSVVNVGDMNLGNLVWTTATIKRTESDPNPVTLEYIYLRMQTNHDVDTELKATDLAQIAKDALDARDERLGPSDPTNLELLTANLSSPPAVIYYTWGCNSAFQVPTSINGYDPALATKVLLGIAAAAPESDTNTYVGTLRVPITAVDGSTTYTGTGVLNRYEGAATIITDPSTLQILSPPSSVTATAEPGGIRLTWTNSRDTRLSHVAIHRSPVAGRLGDLVATTDAAAVTTYLDAGISSGTTYFYTLHSVDTANSESANTNQVSAVAP